ncbi:MAG TPA: hypothetical protein VK841_11920 [Polyangiaceae bacterium]|jgi:hypothetical protein|nr:hypothetical protein [Polyangiaceae bacterium]
MGTANTSFATRKRALQIAALCGCDHRTALKALREGVDSIRQTSVRESVRRAMAIVPEVAE